MKPGFDDLRHRFEAFASQFAERTRPRGSKAQARHALDQGYWESVQDLFTRDVTERGLRSLVAHEAQDTFRFFTREIDFAALRRLPWFKRYPAAVWQVFLATAFGLSPARRILFALAVPVLLFAWLRWVLAGMTEIRWELPGILLAASVLCLLLVLELRDKLALKGDLEVARQIQFGLLPFEPFDRDGTRLRAAMRPANTVGGDYFDVIELGERRVGVVVGDVAGKGMPAALLMALLQGSLRTLVTAGFRGADLMAKLNDHLCLHIPSNRLVTLFYGEYEPDNGELRYVNAGHNPPFVLRRGGGMERLPATAMALGVQRAARVEERRTRLEGGDRLLLFTDGITEAFDPAEREYGEERLAAFLASHAGLGHEALIDAVLADVTAYCGSRPPHDDMTLLVLGRDG